VTGAANTSVVWSIDGAGSGNGTVGSINSSGLYTAPAVVPVPAGVTVRATASADATKSDTGAVTVTSIIEDWPKYRRDLANTGRSRETFIDSSNAGLLLPKWQFTVDSFGGDHKVSASPAVATVNGVRTVYVGAWSGFFYAINADTGTQVWRFEVDRTSALGATNCTTTSACRIGSSAMVDSGVVYFGAENAFVYALNAVDGSLVWKRQLGDPQAGAEIWTSPAVYNGLVYVGVSSHDDNPCVAGKMFALNVADGTIAWQFDAIVQSTCPTPPGPGNCVGVGIWSSPAIDTQFGTMFIGTGNAGNSCIPGTPKAAQDYSDGILGLNLGSGTLKSFYQTNPNDLGDVGDIGAAPVLHQTQSVNQCTSTTTTSYWLSVASKDQHFWTGARDANGMPSATSLGLDDGGDDVASAPAVPYSQTSSCGNGSLIQSSNDFFVPTANGHVYQFRQDFAGAVSQQAKIPINVSGGCATPGNCPLFSAPASTGDMLFFGGGDGNFYGYKSDGTRKFAFGTLGLVASGPAISNGRIYFGSFDGTVTCLSRNGQ
jgi:outer membrane protein assembly factor BamB